MNLLIDLYDNALIYYPNAFFLIVFIVSILGLIFLIKSIIILNGKIKKVIKEVNYELRQIKIKKIKSRKIRIIKFSPTKTIFNFLKFVVKIVKIILAFVNIFFKYLEQQILKLVRKIGKEILID